MIYELVSGVSTCPRYKMALFKEPRVLRLELFVMRSTILIGHSLSDKR